MEKLCKQLLITYENIRQIAQARILGSLQYFDLLF